MKIEADRDVCIGAGMCVMTAEEVFDQDDDGIVVVLEVEVPAGARRRPPRGPWRAARPGPCAGSTTDHAADPLLPCARDGPAR